MSNSNVTCKMLIRMWDIDNQKWEVFPVDVPGQPGIGPRDEYLIVDGIRISPDNNGNFVSLQYSEIELDAVHAFASARLAIDLWEQAIEQKIPWFWRSRFYKTKLHIDLFDPLVNGAYKRNKRRISFGTFGPKSQVTRKSFDIVCHETTHAIIDGLQKNADFQLFVNSHKMIEQICDLCPILVLFSTSSLLEKAINKTEGNLLVPNFISEFAEGYAEDSIGGLHSALDVNYRSIDPKNLIHHFVPTVYNQLTDLVIKLKNRDDSHTVIQKFCKIIIKSLFDSEIYSLKAYYDILSRVSDDLLQPNRADFS